MSGDELVVHSAADVDRAQITGAMVTQALVESREWLALAMKGSDPTPIAEFKAWAATVEEATKQKKLGREIELNAAEMVRRAERGIGVAVRNGQAAGVIAKPGDIGGFRGTRSRDPRDLLQVSESTNERRDTLTDFYRMTDGVSDEQFETAIAAAKEEGNLSRANVVRKVTRQTSPNVSRQQRADMIAKLAQEGYTSRQMSSRVGVTEETVRLIARDFDVEIPADRSISKTRRHDSNRIAQETVNALEGLAMGVELIAYDELDQAQATHWVTSLDESMKVLSRFRRHIKEMTQ